MALRLNQHWPPMSIMSGERGYNLDYIISLTFLATDWRSLAMNGW
jgi:hypothetical protein